MKNLRIIIYFLCLIAFSFSCNKKKDDEKKLAVKSGEIISSNKLANVLTDFYLVEGALSLKELHADKPVSYANQYFKYIFEKHKVSNEQFLTSYKYYAADADEMLKIIEIVLNNLNQKQGMIQGNTTKNPDKKK